MPKRNSTGEAARMARAAASDLANLQRAMRAAEDSMAGLNHALKTARVKTPRHMIKKSTSNPLGFLGNFSLSGGAFVSDALGIASNGSNDTRPVRFYQSAAQAASNDALRMKLAQRNL